MNWLCRYYLLFIVLILRYGIASAQHPFYYQLKETEGIVGSELYSIRQDKKGYVWLAGNEGVFRYDGKEVKQYTCANQNGKSISDIKEDAEGRIWCKNFNGQVFYVSADSLKIAVDISKDYPTYPETAIGEDGVYYSLLGGLAHFNVKNGRYRFWHYPGNSTGLAANIFHTQNGVVYVTVLGKGIFRFCNGKYTIISSTNNKEIFGKLINSRGTLFKWGNRLMFFSEVNPERKYYLSEIVNDSLVVLKNLGSDLTKNRVFNCCPVSDTSLWLCTQEGAVCLDRNLLPIYNGLRLFREADISNVMKDSEENYWFTALDKGVFIVPNIAIWRYDEQNNSLPDDNVTALHVKKNGDVLLGYFNGDVSLLKSGCATKAFQSEANVTMVRKIIADETEEHFLVAQGITTYFDANTKSSCMLYPGGLRDICYASKHKVLFASIQNAGWFTIKNCKTDSVHLLKTKSSRYVAYTSSDNLMWVGYSDGTYYYDSLNTEHELFFNGKKVFATAMKTDTRGHLWIGTVANGLLRINNARVIMHISGEAELNGNNVRAICCKDSLVWVATEKGLNIINTNTDKVSYLDWHDGLPNAEVRVINVNANTVYLATNKGLITFPTGLNTVNSINPQIAISKLMVNDEVRQIQQVIHLNYDENKLTIYFGTKGFTHKHKYSYSYLMKGLDTSWTESGYNTDYARFTSLPPGNYTFYVKAYNEDGFESASVSSIQIHISKPFWATWWFITLSAVAIVGIVSVVFYFRIRNIKQRNALEKGISSSQLAALKAQMNPHFVYNALNSIQDLVLQNDIKSANLYFGKFSNLMRKVLDASGKDKLPLNEEIEILKLYLELEKLRFGKLFEYTIDIEVAIDADCIEIPPMIIQPFVENALKHGLLHKDGDKRLSIRFDLKSNTSQMVCTITDNGIGRKRAAEINDRKIKIHQSFAVNATRKRLELLNKYYHDAIELDIHDLGNDTNPTGTMVILCFPVNTA